MSPAHRPNATGLVVLQNPSIWGPSVRNVIEQMAEPLIVGCPEVHLQESDIDDAMTWWRDRGWKGLVSPARRTKQSLKGGG